jgi:hypothetical protein
LRTTWRPGSKARVAIFSTALLRWLDVTPPPHLTLPNPRTVKLADHRTDEWVARFRELQARLSGYEPDGRGRCITVSSAGRNPSWL